MSKIHAEYGDSVSQWFIARRENGDELKAELEDINSDSPQLVITLENERMNTTSDLALKPAEMMRLGFVLGEALSQIERTDKLPVLFD